MLYEGFMGVYMRDDRLGNHTAKSKAVLQELF